MSLNILILDLETSGLFPTRHSILEVAAIPVSLASNHVISKKCAYSEVVKYPSSSIYEMDKYCFKMHNLSGLISELTTAKNELKEIEQGIINLIKDVFPKVYTHRESLYLCGSSIHFDRGFINVHMPNFARFLHYRMIDVTSYSLVRNEIKPRESERKEVKHRALADAEYSLSILEEMAEIVSKGVA